MPGFAGSWQAMLSMCQDLDAAAGVRLALLLLLLLLLLLGGDAGGLRRAAVAGAAPH